MANEVRLIDANSLIKRLEAMKFDTDAITIDGIIRALKEPSTVDAVPVAHGRWEDEHGGKYANPRYRCSICKERALYKFERDLLDNWKGVQALTNYCPNCGAKMDGDGNG